MTQILEFKSGFMVLFDQLLGNGKFYVDVPTIEDAVNVRANGGPFNCSCGAYCTDDACTKQEQGE